MIFQQKKMQRNITKKNITKNQWATLLFVGKANPRTIIKTKIIPSPIPNRGKISEKNVETKLNWRAISEDANAIITLIPFDLSPKIFILDKIP